MRSVLGRYQAIQFMPDPAVIIIIRIISDSESDEHFTAHAPPAAFILWQLPLPC